MRHVYRLDEVERDAFERIERMIMGHAANGGPKRLAKGTTITREYLDGVEPHNWFDIRMADEDKLTDIPVIYVTTKRERGAIISARDAGVTEILSKPVHALANDSMSSFVYVSSGLPVTGSSNGVPSSFSTISPTMVRLK